MYGTVCNVTSVLMSSVSSVSLDPEQKEQLVEVIEKLLKDQTTVRITISFSREYFNVVVVVVYSLWLVVLSWRLRLCVLRGLT